MRAAGGVVTRVRAGRREVLVLHKGTPSEWRLPKGRIEPGEKPEQAALREVAEETGLACEVVAELGETEHPFPDRQTGRMLWKRTTFYLMREAEGPTGERDGVFDVVTWLPAEEAAERLTFETERGVVRRALKAVARAD